LSSLTVFPSGVSKSEWIAEIFFFHEKRSGFDTDDKKHVILLNRRSKQFFL
jgi:hypothetical protein